MLVGGGSVCDTPSLLPNPPRTELHQDSLEPSVVGGLYSMESENVLSLHDRNGHSEVATSSRGFGDILGESRVAIPLSG